ncbi:ubiquitin carboxyl-terminal hydrolase 4 [Limosa lapponica baueri]|uniref:Ubiquitin carboxyl-terminal hydrolase 4 n=1 Tax=Limosa lapponica baueri TaxID=1758121 RepID=A0A2I0TD25_LIMLA|nr:ubiquitin carboxyl-terminal hydrolase 4 [Limosa lapponica baueri]
MQEEDSDAEIIVKSFSMKDLRNMRKDFSCHESETLISWLLRCWDNGADIIDLDSREARQLGNLAGDRGIDKAIGRKTNTRSLEATGVRRKGQIETSD